MIGASRTSALKSYDLSYMQEHFNILHNFCNQIKSLSQSANTGTLEALLTEQCNTYLNSFHHRHVTNLASALDREKWCRAAVAKEYQNIVDAQYESDKNNHHAASTIDSTRFLYVQKTTQPQTKADFNTFTMIPASLLLIQIISAYMYCARAFESHQLLHHVIREKLCELILLFNSRSCQLVLGAGAIATAGLESITSTHLAICAQTLEFITTQIPILQKYFQTQQSCDNVDAFNRVLNDIRDHKLAIINKLCHIMEELTTSATNQLMSSLNAAADLAPTPHLLLEIKTWLLQVKSLTSTMKTYLPHDDLIAALLGIQQHCSTELMNTVAKLRNSDPVPTVAIFELFEYQILKALSTLSSLPSFDENTSQQLKKSLDELKIHTQEQTAKSAAVQESPTSDLLRIHEPRTPTLLSPDFNAETDIVEHISSPQLP